MKTRVNVRDYLQGRYIVVYKTINDSYDIAFISGCGPIGLRKAQDFIKNHLHQDLQKDCKILVGGRDEIEYL